MQMGADPYNIKGQIKLKGNNEQAEWKVVRSSAHGEA